MIREAELGDMVKIKRLALGYLERSAYKGIDVDERQGMHALNHCRQSKMAFLWVGEKDGKIEAVLAGMVQEYWFSSKDKFATDLVFVCNVPNMAPALMNKFTEWAWGQKRVREVTMGLSSGMGDVERAGQFYETMGYQKLGGLYMLRNPNIVDLPEVIREQGS